MAAPSKETLRPLLRKLESLFPLDARERDVVLGLPHTVRRLDPRRDIASVGERPEHCCLVLEGWAYRYASLREGERQIISLYIAGDVPDLQHLYLPVMDHTLAGLTACLVAFIPHAPMRVLAERHPGIMAALWRDTLVDASIYRERITTLGRRQALGRAAHLFCELYLRQRAVGLAADLTCPLPLTQGELADALGMTAVHLNRSLRALRAEDRITLRGGRLTIHDWDRLVDVAEFDPTYLHHQEADDRDGAAHGVMPYDPDA